MAVVGRNAMRHRCIFQSALNQNPKKTKIPKLFVQLRAFLLCLLWFKCPTWLEAFYKFYSPSETLELRVTLSSYRESPSRDNLHTQRNPFKTLKKQKSRNCLFSFGLSYYACFGSSVPLGSKLNSIVQARRLN
ncbi:hypothetical protein PEPS_07750 [Persicobacter psychrovividus]|uniref:Uncharacterized protein n=1 Tax=Persicobacter psychrovividus TaxID=387638 RepID=A0ABM7VC31_9BACT|nr:hypothetical protein PEPS_07750 [Persicobacter psychrovividus]